MAHKKRKRKHTRSLSAPSPMNLSRRGRRKGGKVSHRRKSRRRGGMLSEIFSPGTAMQSGRTTLSGVMGGGVAGLLNDVIPDETGFGYRLGANLLGSFLLGGVLRAPNMGAGMAGAAGLILYQKIREGNLQEDGDDEGGWADDDVLSEYPMFADADGNPMMLADDGQMYYLDEDGYMVDPAEELSEENFMNDGNSIYPSYVNPSNY